MLGEYKNFLYLLQSIPSRLIFLMRWWWELFWINEARWGCGWPISNPPVAIPNYILFGVEMCVVKYSIIRSYFIFCNKLTWKWNGLNFKLCSSLWVKLGFDLSALAILFIYTLLIQCILSLKEPFKELRVNFP